MPSHLSDSPVYHAVGAISEIDLTRHGLIEASAGTGKTYAIEHLVLRLLKERGDLQLEEILLVTYTEKAAGELKSRIRRMIETALTGERLTDAETRKLTATLDSFDLAAIHTIHGFCHGVLNDYAFENRMPFDTELVDDGPVYAEQMSDIMRRSWPAQYGDDLQLLLHLAGFAGQAERFMALTEALAADIYRPRQGDQLLPQASADGIRELLGKARQSLTELSAVLTPTEAFLEGYAALNFNAAARRSRLAHILLPLTRLVDSGRAATPDLSDFADWYLQIQSVESQGQRGIAAILPEKWNRTGPNLERCPQLPALMACLTNLDTIFRELQYRLQIEAVTTLQEQVPRIKAERGWISYNDMLTRVATALTGSGGERLSAILRRRYKVAFVDEFQDTDPVQWQIFDHLFLDPSLPKGEGGRLFLIGDPKQAIYAFRGADVFAYLSARRRMEGLADRGEAKLYNLATNWRSSPDMIAAFNRLFGNSLWFPPLSGGGDPATIGYQVVSAPPAERLKFAVSRDDTGRRAVTVFDLSGEESVRGAKYRLPTAIAAEIRHLMGPGCLEYGAPGKSSPPKRLGYGDICVLIRSRTEATLVEREFQRQMIPYAHYKKPGLFHSEEAFHLSLVLHAIADPQSRGRRNAALLSPFFDRRPAQLAAEDHPAETPAVRECLHQWRELALAGRWSRLFDSLYGESGLFFRQSLSPQWDRLESNWTQLRIYLQQAIYEKNFDLRGVAAHLDTLRESSRSDDPEADLHQIDTEAPKVQLMTMHVSKGLQFPVVFVAGGLTQAASAGLAIYHAPQPSGDAPRWRKVIDLTGDSGKAACLEEALDEDKRLLYVALTRAQLKLYLPFYRSDRRMPWVGPTSRLLAPALAAGFGPDTVWAQAVTWLVPEGIPFTKRAAVKDAAVDTAAGEALPQPVFPAQPSFVDRRAAVASFTRLQHAPQAPSAQRANRASFSIAEGWPESDVGGAADEMHGESPTGLNATYPIETPEDPADPAQTVGRHPGDRLPGGTRMGSLLHDLLEKIDYGVVRAAGRAAEIDTACQEYVRQRMRQFQIAPAWQPEVTALIWNTLCTPIPCGDKPLFLGDLPPQMRLHEPEFYCHLGEQTDRQSPSQGGYLRGFVDLLFYHGGRYYILDWKSNYLADGYHADAIAAGMQAAGYHLQYRIYALATLRWLGRCMGPRFEPQAHFGGVFYIYLRGMGREPGSGVFYAPPERIGSLAELERDLGHQLERCHA